MYDEDHFKAYIEHAYEELYILRGDGRHFRKKRMRKKILEQYFKRIERLRKLAQFLSNKFPASPEHEGHIFNVPTKMILNTKPQQPLQPL